MKGRHRVGGEDPGNSHRSVSVSTECIKLRLLVGIFEGVAIMSSAVMVPHFLLRNPIQNIETHQTQGCT
jgi:hypothetical protein